MKTIDLLRRRVIELIHNLPYDEACSIESNGWYNCKKCDAHQSLRVRESLSEHNVYCSLCDYESGWAKKEEKDKIYLCNKIGCHKPFPITIGRILSAINNKLGECNSFGVSSNGSFYYSVLDGSRIFNDEYLPCWKLTKENGQETTIEDQAEETIEKLYNLIK